MILEERDSEHAVRHRIHVRAPQAMEETVLQERVSQGSKVQIIAVPLPRVMKDSPELAKILHCFDHIMEQNLDLPVPRAIEEAVEGVRWILQEPVAERLEEEITDVPVPSSASSSGGDRQGCQVEYL